MGLAMKDQQGGIWVVVYCLDKKFIIYLFIQLIVWITDDALVIRAVMGDPRH